MNWPSLSRDEDERLVARCLQGEDAAWEMMFHLYHPQLLSIIRALMRGEGAMEQAEEIAAAVWSSLCSEAFTRLRQYDPRAGRLLGYLASMARSEIRRGRHRSGAAILTNAWQLARRQPRTRSAEGSSFRNSWPP